jgi:single-stranded DNA-binding protein
VVVGRLQQRTWTAEDGSARSVVEVVAEEHGHRGEPAAHHGDRTTTGETGWRRGDWGVGHPVRMI